MVMKVLEGVIYVKSLKDFIKKLNSLDCTIVFIDANYVISKDQVEFAVKKAIKAWNEGKRVAKTLAMEILLYVAARRQISDAIEVGLKEGKNEVVIVILDDCVDMLKELGFKEQQVLRLNKEKIERVKKFYDISDAELEIVGLEKLPLLIRERIALFDVFKSS